MVTPHPRTLTGARRTINSEVLIAKHHKETGVIGGLHFSFVILTEHSRISKCHASYMHMRTRIIISVHRADEGPPLFGSVTETRPQYREKKKKFSKI